MLGDIKHHHFMDISQIDHKDINIQFSVEHILEDDDYQMVSKPKEKGNKNKNCQKKNRAVSKKAADCQLRTLQQQVENPKKKIIGGRLKLKDHAEQKDTQDDSQTVKITNKYLPPKGVFEIKPAKGESNSRDLKSKCLPNKIQPCHKERSRTKSICSVQPDRRRSQISIGQAHGIPSKNNISVGNSNSHSQLQKNGNSTRRTNFEDVKVKNEKIVRNDYFEQNEKIKRSCNQRMSNNEKLQKKRSVSRFNKGEFLNKKTKKGQLKSTVQIKK